MASNSSARSASRRCRFIADMPQSSCATGTRSDGAFETFCPESTGPVVTFARNSTVPLMPAARQLNRLMFEAPLIHTRLAGATGS
jgi:hypothetical protein